MEKWITRLLAASAITAGALLMPTAGGAIETSKGTLLENTGVVIETATHRAGRLLISGKTQRPGQVVSIDKPQASSQRSNASRSFRLVAEIVPGDCSVELSVGEKSDEVDLSSCGPRGPRGKSGKDGDDGADGRRGPAGPEGPAGPAGPAGAAGDPGPRGPSGANGLDAYELARNLGATTAKSAKDWLNSLRGPKGDPGPPGNLGSIAADMVDGNVASPLPDTGGAWAFIGGLGGTVSVTITDVRQGIMATGVAALGTTKSGGATLSRYNICMQSADGGPISTDMGFFENLRIPQGMRMPFQANALLQPGPGNWRIGLCYQDSGGDLDDNNAFKLTTVIAIVQ